MKMQSFWGWPTNPHYDPTRAYNGGGYWQYKGGALYMTEDGHPVVIETEDASQGDFGTIYGRAITVDGMVYRDDWGSADCMGGHYTPDSAILQAAAGKIGIHPGELADHIWQASRAADMAATWAWEEAQQ